VRATCRQTRQEDDDVTQVENAREFSRVEAVLPLAVRRLPGAASSRPVARISGASALADFRYAPTLDQGVLPEWLCLLSEKLDAIIRMLTLQQEGFHGLPETDVVLSGSGMRFASDERFAPGDLLELKMILPLAPPAALYVYAHVVSGDAPDDAAGHTAVKFLDMDDAVRDKVIRFVFEREREALREKRG
jgi:hypothetical protein